MGERGDSGGLWHLLVKRFHGPLFIKWFKKAWRCHHAQVLWSRSIIPLDDEPSYLFITFVLGLPHMSRHMPATALIIWYCVSYILIFFYITPMSCHICHINGICRFGEVSTLSRGVRFVLIRMPLLCHMYPFILCGCVQFCEAAGRKVTHSEISTGFCMWK